jgi:hypothetical protein
VTTPNTNAPDLAARKALAQSAIQVAKDMRALIEQAEALGLNPEGVPPEYAPSHAPTWGPVRAAADLVSGLAWGVAFETEDNDLIGALTDGRRQFKFAPSVPEDGRPT